MNEAVNEVVTEVNAFIADFPNLGDVLDVRYGMSVLSPERAMYFCSVVFVGV